MNYNLYFVHAGDVLPHPKGKRELWGRFDAFEDAMRQSMECLKGRWEIERCEVIVSYSTEEGR